MLGFNNSLARSLIDCLERQGINVPDEISVMGLGGEEVPGLACHQADWYQLGKTAVQILLRALAQAPGPEHHLGPSLGCRLPRQSLGNLFGRVESVIPHI